MLQHIGKFRLIYAIELSNLDFKIVILMFSGSSHFCHPLHLSIQNIAKFNICCNFGLSLIRLKLLFQIFQNGLVVTI